MSGKPRSARGTRTSRTALSEALVRSGLKTQAALAERIAELEDLDSPPKDSVSRAFREHALDPPTIARIARALDVPASSLHLQESETPATADASSSQPPTEQDTRTAAPTGRLNKVSLSVLGVLAMASVALILTASTRQGAEKSRYDQWLLPRFDTLTVALLPVANDPHGALEALGQSMGTRARLANQTTVELSDVSDARELQQTLGVDLVLDYRTELRGRYQIFYLNGTTSQSTLPLLAEIELATDAPAAITRLARRVPKVLEQLQSAPAAMIPPPAPEHVNQYIELRRSLDDDQGEARSRKIASASIQLIDAHPGWALSHALRCEALLDHSWLGNTHDNLDAAASACTTATELQPESPWVQLAHSRYLQQSGQIDAATHLLTRGVPGATPLRAEQAALLFSNWRQSGNLDSLVAAQKLINDVATLEPDYWRWLATAATYTFFAGDLEESIRLAQAATALELDEVTLANLGIAQFCVGDLAAMATTFKRLADYAPQSYLAHEYLGLERFYAGDAPSAARHRRDAIDVLEAHGKPQVHQMWGALADALLLAGQKKEAKDNYQLALQVLEKDYLLGVNGAGDAVHRLYYQLQLQPKDDLDSDSMPLFHGDLTEKLGQVDVAQGLDAGALTRLAQLWNSLGSRHKARNYAKAATNRCAGLGRHPALRPLLAAK